jgi:hypothetical protein
MRGPALFRVTITAPDASVVDVTDRVSAESLGRISDQLEDDLTQLTHGDMDLILWDRDGWVRDYLGVATAADSYELVVERQRLGAGWERLFAGVLDLPASLKFDPQTQTLAIQAFTFGKLLERVTAETYQRTLTARNGTAAAGSKTVTMDTTGLIVGDEFSLDNGIYRETHEVAKITSGSALETVDAWSTSFTGAFSLNTPYYRNRPVETIVGDLFTLAGITEYQFAENPGIATLPFLSGLNTSGLPVNPCTALMDHGGSISVYAGGKRYDAADYASGFGAGVTEVSMCDWRPYQPAQPATLCPANIRDDGSRAPRYTSGGTTEGFNLLLSGSVLYLQKNGVTIATVATFTDPHTGEWYFCEYLSGTDEVWVSYGYKVIEPGIPPVGDHYRQESGTKIYAATTPYALIGNGPGVGQGRSIAADKLAVLSPVGGMITNPLWNWQNAPIKIFERLSGTWQHQLTLSTRETAAIWTLREMGDCYLAMRSGAAGTFVAIWDATFGALLGDYAVKAGASSNMIATMWDAGGGHTPAYIGFADSGYFVVSTAFSNVIPYADFSGLSVGGALAQVALMTASTVSVDENRIGQFIGRLSVQAVGPDPVELTDDPSEATEMALSEWYRDSVKITGRNEAGDEIVVISGVGGDSANRLELDLQLPLTESLAAAVANVYWLALSKPARERIETICEPPTGPLRVYGRVNRYGATWMVRAVELDAHSQTQQITLVEEVA